MSATGMDLINQYSHRDLGWASDRFKEGNGTRGFEHFKHSYIPHQNKVYEQIWIDRGRPQGNAEYGNQTFNDTNGLSSTMQEKAEAIDRYLASTKPKDDPRNWVTGGGPRRLEYVYNPAKGEYEWKPKPFDGDRWGREMAKIFPTANDSPADRDAKLTGIAVGVIGTAIIIAAIVCL